MTEEVQYEQPIGDLVSQCYLVYGEYVNLHRMIPSICDGLIPSHRRVLLSTRHVKKMTKVASILGNCARDYHFHGTTSLEDVVSRYVRCGLLDGQGNHGVDLLETLKQAAPRYVEVKRNDLNNDALFKLVNYAPHFSNDGGVQEPEFLITPIPIMLVYGHNIGIGLGCTTRVPAFTYKSLVEAHRADDPTLLVAQYGYHLLPESELQEVWETGRGRLCYAMDCEEGYNDEDGKYARISGSGVVFKPALGKFKDYEDSGQLIIRNESTTQIDLVIARTSRTKAISDERIYEMAMEASKFNRLYDVRVNVNGEVRRVGLRDWINTTMGLYNASYQKWKDDQSIENIQKMRRLMITPQVASGLQEGNLSNEQLLEIFQDPSNLPDDQITEGWKVEKDDITSIVNKPIKYLRNGDFDSEIQRLKELNMEIKELDPNDLIEDAMQNFDPT